MPFSSLLQQAESWSFDMDTYTNPYTPHSPLHRLPTWISRFLGYREESKDDVGNVLGAVWSCVGAFMGLGVVAAVFDNMESVRGLNPPALIASFGASAVLEYNAIRSPFGQPRNALLGHTISALVGVSITKLFLLHPDFEKLRWIAGAVSCGTASALMLLTGTVHPPGGASAVLAATSPEITAMGWWFVGLVAWGTTLMLVVGLLVNNVQRRFPVYWWTPVNLRELHRERRSRKSDVEIVSNEQTESGHDANEKEQGRGSGIGTGSGSSITIYALGIRLPADIKLGEEEEKVLEGLRARLAKNGDESARERGPSSSRPSTACTMVQTHSRDAGSNRNAEILCSLK